MVTLLVTRPAGRKVEGRLDEDMVSRRRLSRKCFQESMLYTPGHHFCGQGQAVFFRGVLGQHGQEID